MFCGIAALIAAVLLAEGWLLTAGRRAAKAAALNLAQLNREWRALAAQKPAPTVAQATLIEEELARAEAALQALRARLWNREAAAAALPAIASPPASRTDAFFDLTVFVRGMREQAARTRVSLQAEEYFGFSTYAHEGPEPDLVPAIHRQHRIAASLLEILFASRPGQLGAVQRECPRRIGTGIARAGQAGVECSPNEADLFAMDPRLSVRAPDIVKTTAFRLVFAGHSAALRRFLNRLAAGDIPVVVRGVEVEAMKETPRPRPASPDRPELLAMIIRPAQSRFTVTVEFCEIVEPPAAADGMTPGRSGPTGLAAAPGGWSEPPAQPRGRGWIYDLFTPPSVYYDPQTRRLSAAPVADTAQPDPADTLPDLELLGVGRGPFRLQLVGYAGGPDDLRGIFANPGTGETMIGHGGERLAGQGVIVKRLSLDRRDAGRDKDAATGELVATAVVADEFTGEEVVLTNREQCLSGAPVGLFASRKMPGCQREVRAGESFALNGVNYCVEQIDLQPRQAVVACVPGGGTEPLIRTLISQRAPTETDVAPAFTAADKGAPGFQNTP